MAEGRFIAYHRVSTAQQGRSGLGLEAQRQAVEDYLDGGAWTLVAEYTGRSWSRRCPPAGRTAPCWPVTATLCGLAICG